LSCCVRYAEILTRIGRSTTDGLAAFLQACRASWLPGKAPARPSVMAALTGFQSVLRQEKGSRLPLRRSGQSKFVLAGNRFRVNALIAAVSPSTPPCLRVRTRRFGRLCERLFPQEGRPFGIVHRRGSFDPCVDAPLGFTFQVVAQAGKYRCSAAWLHRDALIYSPLPPFRPSADYSAYYALC
jgi:hypothetical protein